MHPDNVFWTADLHFDHLAMVERFRTQMGWTSKEEMTDFLIEQWNSVVPKKGATVYIVGDLFFCNPARADEILKRLNGSQKFVIRGNHDKIIDEPAVKKHFIWIKDYAKVKIHDPTAAFTNRQGGTVTTPGYQPIAMSHYPMITWDGSGRGAWMLHGHCHGNLKEEFRVKVARKGLGRFLPRRQIQYRLPPARRLDVGVDVHNFKPITYEQVKAIMATKGFEPADQHGGKKKYKYE